LSSVQIITKNSVTLAATSLAGEGSGDGTLATIAFEIIASKASTLKLSETLLTNRVGEHLSPPVEGAQITEAPQLDEDVNGDGIVNIQDLVLVASNFGKVGENAADINDDKVVNIVDLTLVAGAVGSAARAPAAWESD
jgi:hypothetical protein